MSAQFSAVFIFLSTPSARRATVGLTKIFHCFDISIHALREEGDTAIEKAFKGNVVFLSTPSARRATRLIMAIKAALKYFYPRPPRGGRRNYGIADLRGVRISIHALREEGDQTVRALHREPVRFLSTPSARRATASPPTTSPGSAHFYPRPPRGGRRGKKMVGVASNKISIHALREEGDRCCGAEPVRCNQISIHALREEGDRLSAGHKELYTAISIHALREEGDMIDYNIIATGSISIHALREEGDNTTPCGSR